MEDTMNTKKAFIFSLDALLAALLLIGGLILIAKIAQHESDATQLATASQDTIQALSAIGVSEASDPWIISQRINGSADGNVSILEQIGYYWATGRDDDARRVAQEYLTHAYPDYGIRLTINDEEIYARNTTKTDTDTIVATRMISGIARGEAISGSSASAHLRYIKNKRNAVFGIFGGYVGEGNISIMVDGVPAGANITDVILELDTEKSFIFSINGQVCDTLTPVEDPLIPDIWSLENCTSFVNTGATNSFGINFSGAYNGSAIAGGYVKIVYLTDQFNEEEGTDNIIYQFPEIQGVINLYDGFYVDGNITGMNITLDFLSEYISYLTIGNASFSFSGSNLTQSITINDSEITAALQTAGLSYSTLSMKTIPLRFGIGQVQIAGTPADIMIVTDTSGSMGWCITNDNSPPCPSGDTTKIISSKNVTADFINSLLNTTVTGTRVGLSEFASSVKSWHNLTSNMTPLLSQVNAYSASGGTCICCGINNATNALNLEGQVIFIQRGSDGWKYNDTDLASPPSGWNTSGYDDSGWKSATMSIGWSYSGLSTTIPSGQRYQGDYFYRKKFNITDANEIIDAKLYVYSDDGADIYLNGKRIDNDYGNIHNAYYWNRNAISVSKNDFVTGENTLAIRQYHRRTGSNPMGFDIQLIANTLGNTTSTQSKNIVIMSDGEATNTCAEQGTGSPTQDAIQAACDAHTQYGIVVYTVGFGLGADVSTMTQMADCAAGEYFSANDSESLEEAFENIAGTIIASSSTQTAIVLGNVSQTILYSTSRIEAEYDTTTTPAQPNEISLTLQSDTLENCTDIVTLYPGMRFVDAKATSYSGEYWTDRMLFDSTTIYNLSQYSSLYTSLGDPYQIRIPTGWLSPGNRSVQITLGTEAPNSSDICSTNNTLIYSVAINLSTERSEVVERAEGCHWTVRFEDNTDENMTIPLSYLGSNNCAYTPGNTTYDPEDAYQLGAYKLFQRLDFKNEGKIFVNLRDEDLEIIVTTISGVPYMWGPATVKLEITR